MLPYKSGDELLRELRIFSNIPVIVISAKDLTYTKVDVLRLGADDYITKPFVLDEVLDRIESCLRRASQSLPTAVLEYGSIRKEVFAMNDVVFRAEGLSKRYHNTLALDDINLTLRQGHICGFIGPNGAGKTTLLRILTRLDYPFPPREVSSYSVPKLSKA